MKVSNLGELNCVEINEGYQIIARDVPAISENLLCNAEIWKFVEVLLKISKFQTAIF
jgi:hypothetical protein